MGQALDSMSPSRVVEGEIEVCHEATMLLQSLEEQRTEVLKVSLSRALESRPRRGSLEEEQTARVKRALGLKDFYEEAMERATSFDQTDEQLADVLYALHYLNLPNNSLLEHSTEEDPVEGSGAEVDGRRRPSSPSSVGGGGGGGGGAAGCPFTRQELQKTLKEVFDVDDATIEMMFQDVRRRQRPQVTLHLHIIEAKELRSKTSKGVAHSYCIVKVSGSKIPYKTEVQSHTVSPFWDCPFLIEVSNFHDAKLTIEVWHEPQESSMEQLPAVRDVREFTRAVLGTNEFKNLLGTVTLPLENIENKLTDDWYNLVKKEEIKTVSLRESFRSNKKRGSLHLSMKASVRSQLNLLGCHWYDTLLNKLLQHRLGFLCSLGTFTRGGVRCSARSNHSTLSSVRNGLEGSSVRSNQSTLNSVGSTSTTCSGSGSSFENESASTSTTMAPWAGTISNIDSFILSQYGAVLNMTPPLVTLSWWKITSKLTVVDQSYLGDLLKRLQECICQKEYSEEEIKEAKSSLILWASCQDDRLRNLHTYFPISSRVISHHQLTYTLRNLKAIEVSEQTQELGIFPKDASFTTLVTDALTEFTKNWWEKTLQNCDRNSPHANEEQQLEAVAFVTGEVLSFLRDVCNFYEAIFKSEADLSYLKLSYILLTSELAARIRPLLLKMYETPVKSKRAQARKSQEPKSQGDIQAMDERGPVWQLYKKLENIAVEIGEKLLEDVQQQSGIARYHSWFLKVVMRWQEQMLSRAKSLVIEEVQRDDFKVFNATSASISTSASEVSYIFQIVKTTWLKLAWPYEVDGDVIASRLFENLCILGKLYAKLVVNKLNAMSQGEISPDFTFFSVETCVALNNIEHLRQEIKGLPTLLQLREDGDSTHKSTVVNNTLKKMEMHLLRFIDTSVKRIKPTLKDAVDTSCDTCSEVPLLSESLDGDLCHLKRYLNEANLRRVLLNMWNALVLIFLDVVKTNSDKRKAEYFKGVHKILDQTWHFFMPTDRSGLDPQLAQTAEYQSLKNNLSNLKMDTELLIAKYYRQRYEEQQRKHEEHPRQVTALVPELIVHVFFTRTGKLQVEVNMARNINECGPLGIRSPFGGKNVTSKQPDSYVQIKLVPCDWFPNEIRRTKTHRKSSSPVFQEIFEFNISSTDHSAKVGLLLFTLKTSQLVQSDGFIGEAVLPLDIIPCVEYSKASSVGNRYLNVNIPKDEDDYPAVKALKFRTWDRKASVFLKELKELKRKKGNST